MEPPKENGLNNLPDLTFGISQTEADRKWKQLGDYSEKFEIEWRKIEKKALQSFEEVTGRKWPEDEVQNGIVVIFSGTEIPHSHPVLTLRHRDHSGWAGNNGKAGELMSNESQIAVLIHELCHRFSDQNSSDIAYVKEKFNDKVDPNNLSLDPRPIAVAVKGAVGHIHTELLWKEVIERLFPKDVVKKMEDRAREVAPMYAESYRIIDTLTDEEKKKVIDYRLR